MLIPSCGRVLVVALTVVLCGHQLALGAGRHHDGHWTYQDQEAWSRDFPVPEGGNKGESPINIIQENTRIEDDIGLELINYGQALPGSMVNDGHTISTSLRRMPLNQRPYVKLNFLGQRDEFYLDDIHFHWGVNASRGSEHKIDGARSFAEMHLVHIKRGLTEEDIAQDNSVAVLGIFIEVANRNVNGELSNIINVARDVNNTNGDVTRDYTINSACGLLPVDPVPVYSYQGSLTTPPTYRSVYWQVFSNPIFVTRSQLYRLSNLFTKNKRGVSKIIGSTFRKTQPLNGRPIYNMSKVRFSCR